MVELLAVKVGEQYCRFRDDSFELCLMNKASVFPLSELAEVKVLRDKVQKSYLAAKLIKLTITEELYQEGIDETGPD